MAPVLQCPDCGTKHPLHGIGDRAAFPCKGCGRILKVPDQARAAVGAASPPPAPDPDPAPEPTRVASGPFAAPEPAPELDLAPVPPSAPVAPAPAPMAVVPEPAADVPPRPPRGPRVRNPAPPRWMRFLLWFPAVPLGFLLVFEGARVVGMLTSAQVEDVYLANGWTRFWPIARLLPVVALVTALLVQAGVVGLTALRRRRHPPPVTAAAAAARTRPAQAPAARPSRRTGS